MRREALVAVDRVDHGDQRYDTVGDWRFNRGGVGIEVVVSSTGDWRSDLLVAVHELVEAALCRAHGIGEDEVDAFDLEFRGSGEPGDDPRAPYHHAHVFAENVERLLAAEMGVGWGRHCERIEALGEGGSNGRKSGRKAEVAAVDGRDPAD